MPWLELSIRVSIYLEKVIHIEGWALLDQSDGAHYPNIGYGPSYFISKVILIYVCK